MMEESKLKQRQNRFVVVYAISLFLAFSPFKILSLITPIVTLLLFIFYVGGKSKYNFNELVLFCIFYALIGGFYNFINDDFLWLNFFLFFITTSPFLFLLVTFKDMMDRNLLRRISDLTLNVLLVEALLGITQVLYNALFITHGLDGGTGDAAMGTVNPVFTAGDGSGSNVYYAIGLSALFVLAISFRQYQKQKINYFVLFAIALGWIIASVMHSIFILLASAMLNALIIIFLMPRNKIAFLNKQIKTIRKIIGIVVLVIICLFWFMPNNVRLLNMYYGHTFNTKNPKSTKAIAAIATYNELSEHKPYQKYVGVGPGQYCSKASLILSGTYLNSRIPESLKSVSPDLQTYILPIWNNYKLRKWKAGSTYFPFCSWLTLYGELGFAGCLLLLIALFLFTRNLLLKANKENLGLILGLMVTVFYLFLLGIQDNYWEWAQFVLPIVLFAKSVYYVVGKSTS